MQKFHGDDWEEVAKECLGDKDFHIESDRINLEDSQALIQPKLINRLTLPNPSNPYSLVFTINFIYR
jgi:hypothetical protein